jgi:two-component system NtrC family sensor kinase
MASALEERDQKLKEYTSQQIRKSERLATLGQLAAGVAHEINNPLGAILMYVHLALEDPGLEGQARANLDRAAGEATRCRDIVRGLLDFARQTEPSVQEANVNEILERTFAVVENQAIFQNIRLHKSLGSSLPTIPLDVGQMQQVFTNIVLNAVEAMDGHGDLTVVTRVAGDGRYIEVEFTDTGRGIPLEQQEKVFEPFFTTKGVGRGTGLGLAVSHGIVARHAGAIELKSKPGEGATFIVKLPLKRKGI